VVGRNGVYIESDIEYIETYKNLDRILIAAGTVVGKRGRYPFISTTS